MYSIEYDHGHIHVYDANGSFLFSADSVAEARKEIREYAQSAA